MLLDRILKVLRWVLIPALLMVWIKAWFVLTLLLAFSLAITNNRVNIATYNWYQSFDHLQKTIVTWFVIIGLSFSIVFFIKIYVFDMFRLPSGSMASTIRKGDIVFINKLIMGPRIRPNSANSYCRSWGYSQLQHNDLVVFNFPEGDTLFVDQPEESYYALKRRFKDSGQPAAPSAWRNTAFKKVTRRPKYIKRIIGLPGDTIEIQNGCIYINHQPISLAERSIRRYSAVNNQYSDYIKKYAISPYNQYYQKNEPVFELETGLLAQIPELKLCFQPLSLEKNRPDPTIFPFVYYWNADHLGPLWIPKKGSEVRLTIENMVLYSRIIDVYEENDLKINHNEIFINGIKTSVYTFKMNYYWVMGDNQPHSYDSRYWGFLPENHIIGISNGQLHL